MTQVNKLDKFAKLDALKLKKNIELSDEYINILYKQLVLNNNNKTNKNINNKRVTVDKTSIKYKLLLKFVNAILNNLNKKKIDDLTKFKNIDRINIIKEENKKLLDNMSGELFKHFNKKKCGYYRKTSNIVLNCLRGMCKEIGLILCRIKTFDVNNSYYKTAYVYSITL